MDTIIDSNIIRRDLKLKDKGFEILIDYLSKTNSRLIFPSIVIEEVKELYKRVLHKQYDEYIRSLRKLNYTLLIVKIPEITEIDFEVEATNYIDYLHFKLRTTEKNIINYKNEYLPELVTRATKRKKPLDQNGQQFRDGLLWLTMLDYAESTTERIVAFISDNPTDFADKGKDKLSSELFEEAKSRNIEIRYFQTLNEFVKKHASALDFITEEWINENIDFKKIEELFSDNLQSSNKERILRGLKLEWNERATGYFNTTDNITSNLIDFFVYEKQDGTLLLNLEMEFETEIEIEERILEQEDTRYEHLFNRHRRIGISQGDIEYFPDYLKENTHFKFIYPVFNANFLISINNKQVVNYELNDW
ncbi:MAG: PIN domain-containing protein [FCB group bacterium]|jgi:hypothetical protein